MTVAAYLAGLGAAFESFLAQDSGNRSYGVQTSGGPRWVKVLDLVRTPLEDVRALVAFYNSLESDLIPRNWVSAELEDGTILSCDWVSGRVLRSPEEDRSHPDSTYRRFQGLPVGKRLAVYHRVLDLFVEIEDKGIVVEDFYDGCLVYDFDTDRAHVCDLDHIHPGPYVLTRDRQYGSGRFMAPEEHRRGSRIDHRTNVYTLGATGFVLLNDNCRAASEWPLSVGAHDALSRAVSPDPAERQASVRALRSIFSACDSTST